MKKSYANMMLVIVTIIWGGGFLATDGALDSLSPFYIMMIRFLGAAVLPLLIGWKTLRAFSREQWLGGILTGCFLFLAFGFQTFGLKYSTPSKNAFLTATNVVFVPYLLWFLLKRKPKRKEITASIFCIIGIALLTLKPGAMALGTGDVLSLLCAVFFALHIIALERYSAHVSAVCMTAIQMLTAGILSMLCALVFEHPPVSFSIKAMGNIAYLIVVSTLLAYLLQTTAQRYTSANTASLILSMEALFASLFSFFLLGERFTVLMLCGAALIFTSVLYLEYKPPKKKRQKE